MKKVLFVDCCIRREASRSKELAEYFIQKLEETGAYEIERLCLMDENLSYFSDGFFLQREALLAEGKFDHPRFRYAHRFAAADKIVIAAPFWDLSFPALLKVYIENLCVDGITFHSDETGLHGLCKADHMVFLTARMAAFIRIPPWSRAHATWSRWRRSSALQNSTALPRRGWISAHGLLRS